MRLDEEVEDDLDMLSGHVGGQHTLLQIFPAPELKQSVEAITGSVLNQSLGNVGSAAIG